MKQDRIKRALHSFVDRMDYKLQRKAYFYILGLMGGMKMSEEQFKIWKQVEAKGLEKLEKVEKVLASTEKEGFKEAHKDYCDFIEKLAETTGLTTGELDRHFTNLLAEKEEKRKETKNTGLFVRELKL